MDSESGTKASWDYGNDLDYSCTARLINIPFPITAYLGYKSDENTKQDFTDAGPLEDRKNCDQFVYPTKPNIIAHENAYQNSKNIYVPHILLFQAQLSRDMSIGKSYSNLVCFRLKFNGNLYTHYGSLKIAYTGSSTF